KRDEVPKGTLSCPDRIMEVFYQLRHYEGSHLLPSVCGRKLIQQTLIKIRGRERKIRGRLGKTMGRLGKTRGRLGKTMGRLGKIRGRQSEIRGRERKI
ncbi:MAG: hypothetical protein MR710_05800, partial [Bacteroidales bacterium]|nr:hypothetical protein [Bacteroidales bacterium]